MSGVTTIPADDAAKLKALLKKYSLPNWPSDIQAGRPIATSLIPALLDWLRRAAPLVEEAVRKQSLHAAHLERLHGRSMLPREVHELVQAAVTELGDDDSVEHADSVLERVSDRALARLDDISTVHYGIAARFAVDRAIMLQASRKLEELQEIRKILTEWQFLSRMNNPTTVIHVHRQGFILLMTIFDATVFDLVRVALRRNFFKLIAAFGKKENVSLERLSSISSFEQLRDQVIEDQLKRKYLKDVLILLESLGVKCVPAHLGYRLVHLVELVMRRNIHVHNSGKVDERYLERDDKGSLKYNVYNLEMNAIAHIDEAYWDRANILCTECVLRIAEWAGGGKSSFDRDTLIDR